MPAKLHADARRKAEVYAQASGIRLGRLNGSQRCLDLPHPLPEALRAVGIFFSQPSGCPIMAFTSPVMMVRIAPPAPPMTARADVADLGTDEGRCGEWGRRDAECDVLAISIPTTQAMVIRHFQERMPYGLFVPDEP